MSDKKCVHKISSPKTTIVATEEKTADGYYIAKCTECFKQWLFLKLPEKLRK